MLSRAEGRLTEALILSWADDYGRHTGWPPWQPSGAGPGRRFPAWEDAMTPDDALDRLYRAG